ncbi:MAG: hypothetical protein NTV10_03800 [Methanoregula sp.]|nr:hypothetical protein [Methanoregula sp.]
MAANPAQADHSSTESSAVDTETKIKNLEREVDLIKTSIKRLLMDIRERMNELENPFTFTRGSQARSLPVDARGDNADPKERRIAELEAKGAALDAREAEMNQTQAKSEADQQKSGSRKPVEHIQPLRPSYPAPSTPVMDEQRIIDEQLLAQFRSQLMSSRPAQSIQNPMHQQGEKLRLQKVYKLFKWTDHAVRKYGNDRLEIMLQSFNKMGHISKDAGDEIREIAKLMPASLGEEHEVGSDEYVAELYSLNRIIAPDDTSLDRDMIEVMMEQRSQQVPTGVPSPQRIEFPTLPAKEKRPSKNQDIEEDWMNLPDRI